MTDKIPLTYHTGPYKGQFTLCNFHELADFMPDHTSVHTIRHTSVPTRVITVGPRQGPILVWCVQN